MKSITFKTVVLVFGLVGFSNLTYGQGERKKPTFAELLKEMDANEDGKLSEAEVKGPLKDGFSDIDTDEDGFISEEEFKNAPKPERKGRGRDK
ncbi:MULTISPECIES: EF-hand domain-containing protein [Winogradskyella]|uniref:EF-hand domain-containing protein n=1 Tax=Winogradskyella TaxID=286104 RepID=UPI0015C6B620|nr:MULTISPECIES: EF-hand domain-containing protein [Winogradskyella]QXP79643.1 EF-hand domain-containing protein [Winogradskyella sp. HaHa_3_26]